MAERGIPVVKRSGLAKWLVRLSWSWLAFDLVLVFAAPVQYQAGEIALLLLISAWLFLSLLGAVTCLMVVYRSSFQSWLSWAVLVMVLLIASLLSGLGSGIAGPHISLLLTLLHLMSIVAVGVGTAIFLYYRDASLSMLAWFSMISIWLMVFAWKGYGNLIEIMLLSAGQPAAGAPVAWLGSLWCLAFWIIPIGIISFLGHTIRLVLREL